MTISATICNSSNWGNENLHLKLHGVGKPIVLEPGDCYVCTTPDQIESISYVPGKVPEPFTASNGRQIVPEITSSWRMVK